MRRSPNHPAGKKLTPQAALTAQCFCRIGQLVPGSNYCITCLEVFSDNSPVRTWWDPTVTPGKARPLAARNPALAHDMLLAHAQEKAAAHIALTDPLLAVAAYAHDHQARTQYRDNR